MVFLIGVLLVILVGGYIVYPLFIKKDEPRQTCTAEELQQIGADIEQEILGLRAYSEHKPPKT
jgi:hypothetical protein